MFSDRLFFVVANYCTVASRKRSFEVLCSQIRGQSRTTKTKFLPAHPKELYLLGKGLGPMLNQENIQYPIMKCRRNWFVFVMKVYLETRMERLNSRNKDDFQTYLLYCHHWFDNKWKSSMAGGRAAWQKGGGNKKKNSIVLILLEQVCTFEFFNVIQDEVSSILFYNTMSWFRTVPKYICHVGCAINWFSMINSGLIPGGQKLSKRQTVFCMFVDPLNQEHKDLYEIFFNALRLVLY